MSESTILPKAVHVRNDRSTVVPLDYPIEFDGKIWNEVTIHRLTAGELQTFFKSGGDGKRFPMFDAPEEVLDALDADDSLKLEEVAKSFLPRRLSGETAPNTKPTSGAGVSTVQS